MFWIPMVHLTYHKVVVDTHAGRPLIGLQTVYRTWRPYQKP
jgi:hypothetical protein